MKYRVRRYAINGDWLVRILKGQISIIEGLPADAEIARFTYDILSNSLIMIVASSTFAEVEEGLVPPDGQLAVRDLTTPV